MHRLILLHTVLLCTTAIVVISANAQKKAVAVPDLMKMEAAKKITVYNRNMILLTDAQHKNGLHLDEKEGDGVAWLDGIHFTTGTLEFDVKGKDLLQQSFVGIAFHAVNDSVFDAIYFRPFNFKSADTARRTHCVQYISMPLYDWQKLRTEHPDKYEQGIVPAPEPNDWLHVRITVKDLQLSVYVNTNTAPSLVVTKLNARKDGKIGFWTGNNSAGDFANLKITEE